MTLGFSTRAVGAPAGVALRNRFGKEPVNYVPLSQFFTSRQRKDGEEDDAIYGRRARPRKRKKALKGPEDSKEPKQPDTDDETRRTKKSPTEAVEAQEGLISTGLESGQHVAHLDESAAHAKSIALMRWLSRAAKELRVDRNVYVVGGAVRNFVIDKPIKDVDVVLDAVAIGRGRDSAWFAKQLQKRIGARSKLATNQYGVAILTVSGDWEVDGHNLKGEVIEIANARSESYGGNVGKGYKPSDVQVAPIEQDVKRREFTFNTLMWRLADLAEGPDKAEIIDLAGCGLKDLKARTMRCPSDPDKTFSDDPTRMLRAIKFMNKYGFKISPDTEASIRRNASKLRNAPSAAIAKLLVGVILKEPRTAKKALGEMKRLGLLDVVAQMAQDDASFRATLSGWANDQRVVLLFHLLDLGLPLKTKLGAFESAEQKRIRVVTATMPDAEASEYLAALKQPGRAWKDKLFFAAMAADLGATGKGIGKLAQRVNGIARDAMLSDPKLVGSPEKLKSIIRNAVKDSGARFEAKIRKCEFCQNPATHAVRAQPTGLDVCDEHLKKAKARLRKMGFKDSAIRSHKMATVYGEMTLSTNVATTPVPVGVGDGRKFLDFGPGHPFHGRDFDDTKKGRKRKRKHRGLSKRLSYLLTIP